MSREKRQPQAPATRRRPRRALEDLHTPCAGQLELFGVSFDPHRRAQIALDLDDTSPADAVTPERDWGLSR